MSAKRRRAAFAEGMAEAEKDLARYETDEEWEAWNVLRVPLIVNRAVELDSVHTMYLQAGDDELRSYYEERMSLHYGYIAGVVAPIRAQEKLKLLELEEAEEKTESQAS